MRAFLTALIVLSATLSTPTAATGSGAPEAGTRSSTNDQFRAVPDLRVRRTVTGLTNPWDVRQLGDGQLLMTERDSARLLIAKAGAITEVAFPSDAVWVSGETGLMSIELDADFDQNRRFYVCQGGTKKSGAHDVRIGAWKFTSDFATANRKRWLLRGLPATSGRHGGCRLLLTRKGALLVGTGDAADPINPQSKKTLGGKVLRLDPKTGDPWPANPWADAKNRRKRYVFTYGHRNVQGLAQRSDGTIWSAEHGPDRDDEINRLGAGRNYGWNPGAGYDESGPMTDKSLPGKQYAARWSSGVPTIATSGAAWIRGAQWGRLEGTLAVAALKGQRVVFMKFTKRGRLKWTRSPASLQKYGRLRSISVAADGDLLITTSNGGGDAVLRVSPRP
jgi:glucose/arabinose dehydrogenase